MMMKTVYRAAREAALLALAIIFAPTSPLLAQITTRPATSIVAGPNAQPATAPVPWLYVGSDVPVDKEWLFGTLPNGLRYAVRRNHVPQHQVAVRVVIDAGSLMEQESERGYAHFMEHLVFRGSKYAGDGDAKRVWQRLGTTFGTDTNANTSFTQTVFKIDLPEATRAGVIESLHVLSGMMAAPSLTQVQVDEERRTVMAEKRESEGIDSRLGDTTRELLFAGQLLAKRAPIGTTESLLAATPEALRSFHDRWYRPERAIIVMCGDGDPQAFVQLIAQEFGNWQGVGDSPAEPDFGHPQEIAENTRVVSNPSLPLTLTLAYARAWRPHNDTIVYNQGKEIERVALKILNHRLEERARHGASYLFASADQSDVSRSIDETIVEMTPLNGEWEKGLKEVRSLIATALLSPPTEAEIQREDNELISEYDAQVEQQRAANGSKLADMIPEALSIRETVASPQVERDIFGGMQGKITPAAVLAATQKLFSGVGPRAILSTNRAAPNAATQLKLALSAPALPANALNERVVSFDDLPKLSAPGHVVGETPLPYGHMKIVAFANKVRLIVHSETGSAGRVFVSVRFGAGLLALPRDRKTVAWAGRTTLVSSGLGTLGVGELEQLMSGRRLGFGFEIGADAFAFTAETNAASLRDQLRLFAAKLDYPRWDAAPVARTRALFIAGQAGRDASPQAVLGHELSPLLIGPDARFATPTRADLDALTPASFKALWAPLLKSGPIEVLVMGDVSEAQAVQATADTLGAMTARPALTINPRQAEVRGLVPSAHRLIRYHKGDVDQAAAVLAWPIGSGEDNVFESRTLDMLATIFNDRMFDKLREKAGASYSPNVSSDWDSVFAHGSSFVVSSQVKPTNVEAFFTVARSIAADLMARPITPDEFERAFGPRRALIAREQLTEVYWLNALAGASRDVKRRAAAFSLAADINQMTAADLQAAARKYLRPDRTLELAVLPLKR